MSIEIKVPDIGADEVEVTELLVKVGDSVSLEQSLMMVEGDKASMEIPSPQAGVVKTIQVAVGDKINTGKLVMIFEADATVNQTEVATKAVPPVSLPPVVEQPNKANAAIPDVNTTTAQNNNAHIRHKQAVSTQYSLKDTDANTTDVHATPVVRRLAREFGVNLANVVGSGRKGRVLREDVQAYVKTLIEQQNAASSSMPGLLPWPKIDFSKFGPTQDIELTRIQKNSAANLHRNWVTIPHVTHFDEADITDLEAFRKQQNSETATKNEQIKITPLVFLMKAAANALIAYPRFNSSLAEDGQKLILKQYINIGVAVDTPNGLLVPVFNEVNRKGILELSHELAEVSQKARAGKLSSAEMQGGCFSISSLGGIGTSAFTPIINAPEVAILGVSKSLMKPIWQGNEFVPRLMLPLSLSFDHRVIDGAEAARFLSYFATVMADIRRLLI